MSYFVDIAEIVHTLGKELREYSLKKRKYIEKPKTYRLPLRHRKCTLKQLKEKYPTHTSHILGNRIRQTLRTPGSIDPYFWAAPFFRRRSRK